MPFYFPDPIPMPTANAASRKPLALGTRITAAMLAYDRPHPTHVANGDESTFKRADGQPSMIASFTKGLPHDPRTGLLSVPSDYDLFRRGITTGREFDIRAIPLGPNPAGEPGAPEFSSAMARGASLRAWESMAAGLAFDLEGPDAQAVTMPPAPDFTSAEVAFEMTELYWMALLRDVPFTAFSTAKYSNGYHLGVLEAVESLNSQPWVVSPTASTADPTALARARPQFDAQTVFRGVLPGDHVGPYLSQFLLAGTSGLADGNLPSDGLIQYGGIRVDQRVRVALQRDYMTSWAAWLDVQNAADVRPRDGENYVKRNDPEKAAFRFMTTPRDLATYVHYDALYEAYLNACLVLLSIGAPFDKGLPFTEPDAVDKQTAFATFGGPHILSLVTEVATRALKAVRFQKFNVHRRARPEVLAARVDAFIRGDEKTTAAVINAGPLCKTIDEAVLNRIFAANKESNTTSEDNFAPRSSDPDPFNPSGCSDDGTYLLPMAFPEGSPMHPTYGAGHATVAGACTTVLKAFFDTDFKLPFAFEPIADGSELVPVEDSDLELTVGGELNKVCSNISIGRNWAGVHYYSDYIESVKMGEQIAIGILQEQKLTFGEKFTMSLHRFDGSTITI